jgi:hypothetical protein
VPRRPGVRRGSDSVVDRSSLVLNMAAYARPTAGRSRNAIGAIPRVGSRHRVSEVAKHHCRFEPRDRCRREAAISQRVHVRVRAEIAFPAAASAAMSNTSGLRSSIGRRRVTWVV